MSNEDDIVLPGTYPAEPESHDVPAGHRATPAEITTVYPAYDDDTYYEEIEIPVTPAGLNERIAIILSIAALAISLIIALILPGLYSSSLGTVTALVLTVFTVILVLAAGIAGINTIRTVREFPDLE